MEKSLIIFFLVLILSTVLGGIYTRNGLGNSVNFNGTKSRAQESESKPNYRYKAEISRKIGDNIIAFLKSIIPNLQPKVDFASDAISDAVDVAQARLMQNLENTNNTIKGIETFFTNMYEALIVNVNGGKGAREPLPPLPKRRRLEKKI